MRKSKPIRQIIKHCMLLCAGMLAIIAISAEALEASAERYAGIYFVYPNELGHMYILIETDTGVDDDHNHRRIHFTYEKGCNEPNWEWHHFDYDYWGDGSGIPGKKNRRLWVIHATNLTPDCFYDVTFKYRDTWAGEWNHTHGHFWSAPRTSSTNPDHIPKELKFYAYGDTRTIDNTHDLQKVAEAIMSHKGKHTFILHTGDIVYKGGLPVGYYWFRDGYKDNDDPEPCLLHKPDWWSRTFFKHSDDLSHVWEMLRHMPIFPALGNHDFQDTAVHGKYTPSNNVTKKHYTSNKNKTYNYRHYFRGYNHGDHPKDQYYQLAYGPVLIWALTSYPMDIDEYCSDTNANFRPKDKGGTGQWDWLKDTLEASANDPRQWKIVMLHTPMYSPDSCNNQEDARKYLKPLFEEYGVDLVLTGHEHYYARKTVNDIPYLILGGGGAGLSLNKHSPCRDDPQCKGFDWVANKHHFAYFHIKGDIMEAGIHNEHNALIDNFTVDRTPHANFKANPSKEPPPLIVNFTDKSTGNIYKYDWDFGDGSDHSQEQNPTHEYTEEGIYTVKRTVSSAFNSSTHTATIHVGPVADFYADPPREGKLGLSVNFYDQSRGYVLTYLWDFGDGTTSTDQDPVHEYDNGKFSVKLTVNGQKTSDTKTRHEYIKVEPYADFVADRNKCRLLFFKCHDGCTVHFTDQSRGDSLTYHWDFGDGSTSTAQNPSHVFAGRSDRGLTYKVRLVVTDGKGFTDSKTGYIEVWCQHSMMHR